MSTILPTSVPTKRLQSSITATDLSFQLSDILGWDGVALTSASFGTIAYVVFRNANNTQIEIMEIDPSTIASTSITITRRGLNYTGDLTTESSTRKFSWTRGTLVELGTHVPQLLMHLLADVGDETIGGVKTFTSSPIVPDPTTGTQVANKEYVDGVAVAGAPNADATTKGIVEEATQAEIRARTAAGGTSARLYPNPSMLPNVLIADYVADTGSATAYAIAPTPAIVAYVTGQRFTFKAANANSGTTPTLNVNALGTKTIVKRGAVALAIGDIAASSIVEVEYDGTNFQLIDGFGKAPVSQDGLELYAVDAGSANVYTATLVPAVAAYTAGLTVRVKIATSSTAASTLNVSGLGTKTIKKLNGSTDITKGDLVAGSTYIFTYDGTNFVTSVPQQNYTQTLSLASNSGATVITTGFKPRVIRFNFSYLSSSSGGNFSLGGYGIYANGTSSCVLVQNTAGSGSPCTNQSTLGGDVMDGQAASNLGSFTGVVGTLTDTGFTLTLANATGATPTVNILVEAQS